MENNYYDKGYNNGQGYSSQGYGYQQQGGYTSPIQVEQDRALSGYVATVMQKVFVKMGLGLLVTAIVALFTASSPALLSALYGNSWAVIVLCIVELGLVFAISGAINKMNAGTATALFYLYSAVNGLTMSVIFLAYTMSSIASTFFITAGTFGVMAAYGYITKSDLSKIGSILFMALIGLIIASIVNIFLGSSTLTWIISIAGVAIFVGLTAWDTQKIKQMAAMTDVDQSGKVSTIGALMLYLDFINLFIYLLRIFGSSRA